MSIIKFAVKFELSNLERCHQVWKGEFSDGNDDDSENPRGARRFGPGEAGQLIEASLDMVLGNDITSPVAINEMQKMKKQTVFDRDKIALVMDHFIPNKDIKSAENCKCCRDFAREHEITNYFDVGAMGIEHALLPEKGLVTAGRR